MRVEKGGRVLSKIDKVVYNAILATLLIIIVSLTLFIITSELKITTLHESLLTFTGTLGGAFLGAWLAGRYALNIAKHTINENKLWNYEEFRKLLLIYKRNLLAIHSVSDLIARGNLPERDLNLSIREIIHHYDIIDQNIQLSEIPTDFYMKIKMIKKYTFQLKSNAQIRNITMDDKSVYDLEYVNSLMKSYKKYLSEMFEELKI